MGEGRRGKHLLHAAEEGTGGGGQGEVINQTENNQKEMKGSREAKKLTFLKLNDS